jgi:hypothetical protein
VIFQFLHRIFCSGTAFVSTVHTQVSPFLMQKRTCMAVFGVTPGAARRGAFLKEPAIQSWSVYPSGLPGHTEYRRASCSCSQKAGPDAGIFLDIPVCILQDPRIETGLTGKPQRQELHPGLIAAGRNHPCNRGPSRKPAAFFNIHLSLPFRQYTLCSLMAD